VIDPLLIRDHEFRAIPPCHAQLLHIKSARDALASSDVDPASVMMVKRTEYGVVCPAYGAEYGWPFFPTNRLRI
jgi:hypothetical protein